MTLTDTQPLLDCRLAICQLQAIVCHYYSLPPLSAYLYTDFCKALTFVNCGTANNDIDWHTTSLGLQTMALTDTQPLWDCRLAIRQLRAIVGHYYSLPPLPAYLYTDLIKR